MSTNAQSRRLFARCACCEPAGFVGEPRASRRAFLAGAAAAGAGLGLATAGLRATPAAAQAGKPAPRIDVHHHIVPPVHAEALTKHRSTSPVKWSPASSLEDMDKAGVTTSVVSVINPGVWFGQIDDESRKLARQCNEYAAKLEQDHPGRFRSFAVIPLPDTEGSLREIEYSLDTLKAEGIALWTSYSEKYLGDPAFVPVFEELNRRKAVVYTHPTTPVCCGAGMIKGVSPSSIEYATDTTRTVASLIFGEAGTAFRFPDIKWIWSHSGGTIPFLTSRFQELAKRKTEEMPNGVLPVLQRFYYEVAQGNTPGQLAALFKMVDVSQVMFGSDYPYRPGAEAVHGLADYKVTGADLAAIDSGNAIRLMPRLRA